MENIRAILAQLHKELKRAEDVDIEAREIFQGLNRDVEGLDAPDDSELRSVLDRAKALESKFAARHPVLEQMARELADTIAKMGI
jgi:hypothetical protein